MWALGERRCAGGCCVCAQGATVLRPTGFATAPGLAMVPPPPPSPPRIPLPTYVYIIIHENCDCVRSACDVQG
jgi:hypothetical protein